MRILVLDSYYPAYLDRVYSEHASLAQQSYSEQWRSLMDECFGTADFYSSNLIALGHEATEVVANCEPLQRRWASEQGINLDRPKLTWRKRAGLVPWPQRTPPHWFYTVLLAQVKRYRPDVLHMQDMNGTSAQFLREVRPHVKLITGQIACPISRSDFREYDLVLSSFPHFVEKFRAEGLRSEYFNLGFEPRVLERLQKGPRRDVVFIGGLSSDHVERTQFLEHIAQSQPLDVWGYGCESLSESSPLRRFHHGGLWALEMYRVLNDSRIALNHHISVAGRFANNMRLYEATGVGALLVTDSKENLATLFEPGKEVVAYHSPAEALELIDYYLGHESERTAIAQAGQARTLREHTYHHRMEEFINIVRKAL